MEGESTTAVVSGFVLGALAFQHLNTDSDTVSRGLGRDPASPRKGPPNPLRLGDLRAAAARVQPVGSPPPTPRLSAVGAAFSRSREVLEMPDAFTRVSCPLATSAFPCLARSRVCWESPFLVEVGREGIESSHSVPPAARNVAG